MERYRRDLKLSRRVKWHPSKARTVRRRRLKTICEFDVWILGRVEGRGWVYIDVEVGSEVLLEVGVKGK